MPTTVAYAAGDLAAKRAQLSDVDERNRSVSRHCVTINGRFLDFFRDDPFGGMGQLLRPDYNAGLLAIFGDGRTWDARLERPHGSASPRHDLYQYQDLSP